MASQSKGYNLQNLKRGSRIREAIVARPGRRILHRDSSQIEARMVAWMARCESLLRAFEEGRDVYSEFASGFYRMTVTKADKPRRFVGKTSILGLGYGCGPPRFRHMLFIGNGGISVSVTDEEAVNLVNYYRREKYPEIPKLWERAGQVIAYMAYAGTPAYSSRVNTPLAAIPQDFLRGIEPSPEGLWLPNGMCIQYPNLRMHSYVDPTGQVKREIVYDSPYKVPKKLFGGKVVENVSQALARIVITDAMVRIKHETGVSPFMSTHDSLDYDVPESEAEWWDKKLEHEFAIRPSWAPDLPLASEGGWGVNLALAEMGDNA